MSRARVLVVDDSAMMRELLSSILCGAHDLEVVGTARDPMQALPMLERLKPNVMTLDVEMPGCDGLTFLGEVMRARPLPVVMISSLTERGSDLALRALQLGAVDVVGKPKLDLKAGVMERADELVMKVRAAASARPRAPSATATSVDDSAPSIRMRNEGRARVTDVQPRITTQVIAVGASTGGTQALESLLSGLPVNCPPVLIVQHMPEAFTGKFAKRLDGLCRISVREARDGDSVLPGTALIAPGGLHMRMVRGPSGFLVRLGGEPNTAHRPSVDELFESVAATARARAIGVIMTGMGADGARGLLAMRRAGAHTFAQDEESCVVFGMPKEAIARGGVERVLPLGSLARAVIQSASKGSSE
jgi:two-component system chemotaxis response regulator CheB